MSVESGTGIEAAANKAAAEFCVPCGEMVSFIGRRRRLSGAKIVAFAEAQRVHPRPTIGSENLPDFCSRPVDGQQQSLRSSQTLVEIVYARGAELSRRENFLKKFREPVVPGGRYSKTGPAKVRPQFYETTGRTRWGCCNGASRLRCRQTEVNTGKGKRRSEFIAVK